MLHFRYLSCKHLLSIYLFIFLYLYSFCSEALGEAYNGENCFADSLEAFGAGQDDPLSVSVGGSRRVFLFKLFNYKFLLIVVNNFH